MYNTCILCAHPTMIYLGCFLPRSVGLQSAALCRVPIYKYISSPIHSSLSLTHSLTLFARTAPCPSLAHAAFSGRVTAEVRIIVCAWSANPHNWQPIRPIKCTQYHNALIIYLYIHTHTIPGPKLYLFIITTAPQQEV